MNLKIHKRRGASGAVESVTAEWTGLGAGETGRPVRLVLADQTVQVSSEMSIVGILIEGSNDGENYSALTDAPGAVGRTRVSTRCSRMSQLACR